MKTIGEFQKGKFNMEKNILFLTNDSTYELEEVEAILSKYYDKNGELPEGSMYVRITPKAAKKFYDAHHNKFNRQTSIAALSRLSTEIENHQFEDHIGGTLLLDKHMTMTDFHHRMQAIQTAFDGFSTIVLLQFGVMASNKTDTGTKRSGIQAALMAHSAEISPEGFEALNGVIGKALRAHARMHGGVLRSNTHDQSNYIFSFIKYYEDEIVLINNIISNMGYTDKNNFFVKPTPLASLLDAFFKGVIDYKLLEGILFLGKLYFDADDFSNKQHKKMSSAEIAAETARLYKECENTEYEVSGTRRVWDSVFKGIKAYSRNSDQKILHYFVSEAIRRTTGSNVEDSKIEYSKTNSIDNVRITKYMQNLFHPDVYKDKCVLKDMGGDNCRVVYPEI